METAYYIISDFKLLVKFVGTKPIYIRVYYYNCFITNTKNRDLNTKASFMELQYNFIIKPNIPLDFMSTLY